MKFDSILEYQKIDQELLALENEVAKSDERKKVAYAKSALDKATETIGKLTQDANAILSNYTAIADKMSELTQELDSFDGILEDIRDATEAEYYLKTVASIASKIAELEKDANAISQKIDQINNNYKKTWNDGVKATENYKSAKKEYDAFVRDRQPKVVEINQKLASLKANIPASMMNAYSALRSAKKMPAFVVYDQKAGVCGRCFMDLANDTKSKLRNAGDYAECPNCRRILFVPENE